MIVVTPSSRHFKKLHHLFPYSFMCVYLYMCMHISKHTYVPKHTMWVPSVGSSSLPHLAVSLALHSPFPVLNLLGKLRLKELCVLPKLAQLSKWLWSHVSSCHDHHTNICQLFQVWMYFWIIGKVFQAFSTSVYLSNSMKATTYTWNYKCRLPAPRNSVLFGLWQACLGSQASCQNVICQHRMSFPW